MDTGIQLTTKQATFEHRLVTIGVLGTLYIVCLMSPLSVFLSRRQVIRVTDALFRGQIFKWTFVSLNSTLLIVTYLLLNTEPIPVTLSLYQLSPDPWTRGSVMFNTDILVDFYILPFP